jgi:hypothetical protein
MPDFRFGEVLSEEISDLRLGGYKANLHSIPSESFNEPVNRDAMRSRHMPQGA